LQASEHTLVAQRRPGLLGGVSGRRLTRRDLAPVARPGDGHNNRLFRGAGARRRLWLPGVRVRRRDVLGTMPVVWTFGGRFVAYGRRAGIAQFFGDGREWSVQCGSGSSLQPEEIGECRNVARGLGKLPVFRVCVVALLRDNGSEKQCVCVRCRMGRDE
jgi:hypothetical protein